MNILLIATQYPPSPETGAKRPWLLAKEFRKLGHGVTVLSHQEPSDKPSNPRIIAQSGRFGERVLRVKPLSLPGIQDLSFSSLWRMRTVLRNSELLMNHDVAVLTGPPFGNFLLAPTIVRLGITTILDYRDGWSADPYPFRSMKDYLLRHFGRLIEPVILRRASGSVFISDKLRSDHMSLMGVRERDRSFVIPNGVDVEEFTSVEARHIKQQLGFPSEIRAFIYTGSLSPDIGADIFAQNLNVILASTPPWLARVVFIFIGPSIEYARYFDTALIDKRVFFLPAVSLRDAYAYIKGADVLLSLGGNQAQRLNRKIFEYAAATRPVVHIGIPEGETAAVVRQHRLGAIVPLNDREALERELQTRAVDPELRITIGERALLASTFSTERLAGSYLQIIQRLSAR